MDDRKEALANDLKHYPPALTKEQVAEILNISTRKVDDLVDRNKINSFVVDPDSLKKQVRVNKSDLIEYMVK